jgi:hypothetical protein
VYYPEGMNNPLRIYVAATLMKDVFHIGSPL